MKETEVPDVDVDPQMNLSTLTGVERADQEETEVQEILRKTTQDALSRGFSIDDVKRVLEARAELIRVTREIAVKSTAPEDWTLYRARDGAIIGVPTSAGALKIRRWAGVSILNHRGMSGQEHPTVRAGKNAKGDNITIIEGLADGFCGRDTMPAIYFCVRSDDDFVGRATAKNNQRAGGPREQDLMSCWRTGIDSKVVRCMTGTTKLSATELKAFGIDTDRSVKGAGFGTAQERTAGSVAEGGVKEAADALWKDILRCVHGSIPDAKSVLRELTAYPEKPGSYKAFAGIDMPEKFTTIDKVQRAADKFQKHAMYAAPPMPAGGAAEEGA